MPLTLLYVGCGLIGVFLLYLFLRIRRESKARSNTQILDDMKARRAERTMTVQTVRTGQPAVPVRPVGEVSRNEKRTLRRGMVASLADDTALRARQRRDETAGQAMVPLPGAGVPNDEALAKGVQIVPDAGGSLGSLDTGCAAPDSSPGSSGGDACGSSSSGD